MPHSGAMIQLGLPALSLTMRRKDYGTDRAYCNRGLHANRANAAAGTTGRHVLARRRPNARDGAGRERHPTLPRYAASQRRPARAAAPRAEQAFAARRTAVGVATESSASALAKQRGTERLRA